MDYVVYKPSAKAIRKGVLFEDHRLILLGDGSALLYAAGTIIQSDILYRRKDSHLVATDEPVPESLHVTMREAAHIADNKISLPIKRLVILQ